jgi:F0F1-type ATP synthase gamma subunit
MKDARAIVIVLIDKLSKAKEEVGSLKGYARQLEDRVNNLEAELNRHDKGKEGELE